MKVLSRIPARDGGTYRMGYAVIAAALALALFVMLHLAADSLPRTLQLISAALGAGH